MVVVSVQMEELVPYYVSRAKSGKVLGFHRCDPKTIRCLVDYWGRVPRPPHPAYEQLIDNKPWVDFTSTQIVWVRE